jgi:hypothetical protein
MSTNFTAETIYELLRKELTSGSIKVVKDNFPGVRNQIEYAKIVIKSDDRVGALELVDEFLKDNNINFQEKVIRGSTFKSVIIEDYYKVGRREKGIRIFFKYSNGKDLKNFYMWNGMLENVFKNNRSLERAPRDRNEVNVIAEVNKKIESLGNGMPVTLYIRNKRFVNVAGFVGGVGTKKADFVIVDYSGNEIGFLSYKKGNSSLDFQQYGGITDRSGKKISEHPEVEEFKKVIIDNWETYKKDYKTVWGEIDSNNLKKQAVFGKDYIRKSGHDSVDFLVQGTPRFRKNGDSIYLTFSTKMVRKGDLSNLQGNYDPVLGARSGERSRRIKIKSDSIYGVRGGVWTRAYMTRGKNKEI